jgi:hypothetical protein
MSLTHLCCSYSDVGLLQMSRLVLSPHIYPGTVTGDSSKLAATVDAVTYRWDQSWGWKMQGLDSTSSVSNMLSNTI